MLDACAALEFVVILPSKFLQININKVVNGKSNLLKIVPSTNLAAVSRVYFQF